MTSHPCQGQMVDNHCVTPIDPIEDDAALLPSPHLHPDPHLTRDDKLPPSSQLYRHLHICEVVSTLVVSLAAVCSGTCLAYSSPAIPELEQDVRAGGLAMTKEQVSWFASLLAVGGLLGGLLQAIIIDKAGRKLGVMCTAVPFSLGWMCLAAATDITVMYIGRIFTGIGTGMVSLVVPIYIAEIVSKQVRGMLGSVFHIALGVGMLLVYCAGMSLQYKALALVSSALSLLMLVAIMFVPETPTYLYKSGHPNEAEHTLRHLRPTDQSIECELDELDKLVHTLKDRRTLTAMLSDGKYRSSLLTGAGLMLFQQLSGMLAIAFYSETIFTEAGFKNNAPIVAVSLAAAHTVVTLVTCYFIDRLGRRFLLVSGGVVQVLACLALATFYLAINQHWVTADVLYMKIIAIGSLCLFVSAFSVGWGPVPWVVISEIFPLSVRGQFGGIAIVISWLSMFFITKIFVTLTTIFTALGAFVALAIFNFTSVLFAVFCVKETKGRSLAEIEKS